MSILNSVKQFVTAYGEYAERSAALRTLKQLDEHQLADIGIAPHLLEAGVAAYPWKNEGVTQNTNSTRLAETVTERRPMSRFTLFSAWGQPIRPW